MRKRYLRALAAYQELKHQRILIAFYSIQPVTLNGKVIVFGNLFAQYQPGIGNARLFF